MKSDGSPQSKESPQSIGSPQLVAILRQLRQHLGRIASERIIQRGRHYFDEGRVLSFVHGSECLVGAVRGRRAMPYTVEIFLKEGLPVGQCDCPYDFEDLCKHAIAMLFAASAKQMSGVSASPELTPSEQITTLHGSLIDHQEYVEREKRKIRALSAALSVESSPPSPLGRYTVRSADSGQVYDVVIRDRAYYHASCSCADFRLAQIQTCKHVELVIHYARNRFSEADWRTAIAGQPLAQVYVGSRRSLAGYVPPQASIRIFLNEGAGVDDRNRRDEIERFRVRYHREHGFFAGEDRQDPQVAPSVVIDRYLADLRVAAEHCLVDVDQAVWAILTAAQGEYATTSRFFFSNDTSPLSSLLASVPSVVVTGSREVFLRAMAIRALRPTDCGASCLVLCSANALPRWVTMGFAAAAGDNTQALVCQSFEAYDARENPRTFDFLILDQPDARWTMARKQELRAIPAKRRLMLTAVEPLAQPSVFYDLCAMLPEEYLGPRWRFIPHFCEASDGEDLILRNAGEVFESALGQFVCRLTQSELPPPEQVLLGKDDAARMIACLRRLPAEGLPLLDFNQLLVDADLPFSLESSGLPAWLREGSLAGKDTR